MSQKIKLEGLKPFIGNHCETTALKRALDYHGSNLSEDMLLGLGGGPGFIYWHMKGMPWPFIGARNGKVAEFALKICQRIGIAATAMETASAKKGYEELLSLLQAGEPAVAYVDMPYLPYLAIPEIAHFGGHVILVFGIDEEKDLVHIYDRGKHPVTASIDDLAKARGAKFPPFPPKHRLLKIKYPEKTASLERGIKESIRECCQNMLTPPIKNIGLAGMEKWASLVTKWPQEFKGFNLFGALMQSFIYIETGGTGGSAFRPMYARFLDEASVILDKPELKDIARMMRESAGIWSQIAAGLLPDSYPALKRYRELILEKNRLFEEQAPGALDAMRKMDKQFDQLMPKAEEDLRKPVTFLNEVQQLILKCHQIETRAFQELNAVVAN